MGNVLVIATPAVSENLAGAILTPFLFVVDSGNNRIQVFDRTIAHNYLFSIGPSIAGLSGNLNSPYGVATDGSLLYITDSGNDRVVVTDLHGNFVRTFGTFGNANGQFSNPLGIAVQNENSFIWVVDSNNNRFQVFDNQGNWIYSLGSLGDGPYQFDQPTDCYIDSAYFWIDDAGNNRWLYFALNIVPGIQGSLIWDNFDFVVSGNIYASSAIAALEWPDFDFVVSAKAKSGNVVSGNLIWPGWTISAYTGGVGNLIWPMDEWVLTANLISGNLAEGNLLWPGWSVSGSLRENNLAFGSLVWPEWTVSGRFLAGSIITGNLIWPEWSIAAATIPGLLVQGKLIWPKWKVKMRLIVDRHIIGELIWPQWALAAVVTEHAGTPEFTCIVMNVNNKALSRYLDYPWTGFIYINGKYYATDGSTGIYELEGHFDNGIKIIGIMKFRLENLNQNNRKHRIREVWVTCRDPRSVEAFLQEHERRIIPLHKVEALRKGDLYELRFKAPLGLKGVFYSVLLKGADDLDINTVRVFDEDMAYVR
jgi:hypothetical protein